MPISRRWHYAKQTNKKQKPVCHSESSFHNGDQNTGWPHTRGLQGKPLDSRGALRPTTPCSTTETISNSCSERLSFKEYNYVKPMLLLLMLLVSTSENRYWMRRALHNPSHTFPSLVFCIESLHTKTKNIHKIKHINETLVNTHTHKYWASRTTRIVWRIWTQSLQLPSSRTCIYWIARTDCNNYNS